MTPERESALEACAEALLAVVTLKLALDRQPCFTPSSVAGSTYPEEVWRNATAAMDRLEGVGDE